MIAMKEKLKRSWYNLSSNQSCYNWHFMQEVYTRWQKNCYGLPDYFWIWVISSEISRLLKSTAKFLFLKTIGLQALGGQKYISLIPAAGSLSVSSSRMTYSSSIKYPSLNLPILAVIIWISCSVSEFPKTTTVTSTE